MSERPDTAERARRLFRLAGAVIDQEPQEIAGTVIAQLLASWLMCWPAGEDRAYALGTITGAALKLSGGLNGEGQSDDVSTGA